MRRLFDKSSRPEGPPVMQGQLFSTATSRMACPAFGLLDLTAPLCDAVTGNGFHTRRPFDLVPLPGGGALDRRGAVFWRPPILNQGMGGGVTRRGYRTGRRGVGAAFHQGPVQGGSRNPSFTFRILSLLCEFAPLGIDAHLLLSGAKLMDPPGTALRINRVCLDQKTSLTFCRV